MWVNIYNAYKHSFVYKVTYFNYKLCIQNVFIIENIVKVSTNQKQTGLPREDFSIAVIQHWSGLAFLLWYMCAKRTSLHSFLFFITTIMSVQLYSYEEIAKHNTKNDLYMVINKKVYDITKFLDEVSLSSSFRVN
jgi:cytochrome b involved in lipid metabolism